ncbi:MAG: hypothetical protein CMJ31_03215 [Phycisphaerae bacterium]|nr:hypothetical protein [Phycisphaerae bacterium]
MDGTRTQDRSRRAARGTSPSQTKAKRLRVIVVAQPGLQSWRENGLVVEVVDVRGPLEAIAEASEVADADLACEAVVVMGESALTSANIEDEIEALHAVHPGVKLVHVGDPDPSVQDLFDAGLPRDASIEAVHDTIAALWTDDQLPAIMPGEADGPVGAESELEGDALIETIARDATVIGPRRRDGQEPIGDTEVIEQILAGRSVIDRAVKLIRRRLRRDDVEFSEVIDAEAPAPNAAAAVTVGDEVVGRLALTSCSEREFDTTLSESLAMHAGWLSGWIRLSRQSQSLRRAALTDPLTGAWNRRYCSRFLAGAIDRARRERHVLTVLYFDIDEFKHYNDRYGHAAGDEILSEVVKALRAVIRPSDRVCRVGGDEFVVIFFEPDGPRRADSRPPESVYVLTKRLQQKIREKQFPKLGSEAAGRLTISGGLATYPWDGADAESLLQRADELAMQSKRQGKNAVTLGPGAERVCDVRRSDLEATTLSGDDCDDAWDGFER